MSLYIYIFIEICEYIQVNCFFHSLFERNPVQEEEKKKKRTNTVIFRSSGPGARILSPPSQIPSPNYVNIVKDDDMQLLPAPNIFDEIFV